MKDYKILKLIGEGTYSTVYSAIDLKTNETVAIKSIARKNLFINEIKIMKLFCADKNISENIVKPLNVIQDEYNVYLVYELCQSNLITFINEHEFEEKNILMLMRMILLGIYYVHQKGIIHRDIKMSNILVEKDKVKICDFGLSSFCDEPKSEFCGTVGYLAPEIQSNVFDAEKITKKIDIYAIGMVFKILLTKSRSVDFNDLEISLDLKDFLLSLVNEVPENRPSAEKALSNTIFEVLFPKLFDFQLLSSFEKDTKYGKIVKTANTVSIHTKNEVDNFTITVKPPCVCKSHVRALFILEINGVETPEYILSTKQMKYYNYLITYLKILAKNTVLEETVTEKYKFKYFLSENYIYETDAMKVEKYPDYYLITNNGKSEKYYSFPEQLNMLKRLLDQLLNEHKLKVISKYCSCNQLIDNEQDRLKLDISPVSIEPSLESGMFPPGFTYINQIGWMVKNNYEFTFLLNNGHRFVINIFNNTFRIDNKEFNLESPETVDKSICGELKIAKQFFEKIVNNLY